ncbi:MAG: hypothetical protein ABSB96_11240 [Gaiellaceae bacterium]
MSEPQELSDYLADIAGALSGRRSYRQEIVAELRSHLLDGLDSAPAGAGAASSVIARFGPVEEIAHGFNALLRKRRLRVLRSVLAIALVSAAGGATVARSLGSNDDPRSFASFVGDHPSIEVIPGKPNAVTFVPKTHKVVSYFKRT